MKLKPHIFPNDNFSANLRYHSHIAILRYNKTYAIWDLGAVSHHRSMSRAKVIVIEPSQMLILGMPISSHED